MSELYDVEQAALDGYNSYNFPKVVNAITRFTNVTLSSLYFDIMKDCLYANAVQSHERRAVVTVLQKILETMSSIIAPITPYLAEEIHDALNGGTDKSVFSKPWLPLGSEWKDPSASSDMATLLRVREEVLLLLEKARAQKLIGSSLEADVDLILPSDLSNTDPILSLLRREESFLKTLFITSDARFLDSESLSSTGYSWSSTHSLDLTSWKLELRIRAASLEKCPRCWTFTKPVESTLCPRCSDALNLH
jgi:isoleucyl-tRNA synthetase